MHHHLRHLMRRFSHLNPLIFLIAAVISGGFSVYALRANNLHMEHLKVAVYAADRDNGNVQLALTNLQAYVTAHMNTNLTTGSGSVYPPIQLQQTYLRQAPSEAGLYTQAQNYCQQQDPIDFSGRNRVPCIEQFITSHGSTTEPALYQFDFVSPAWSPDAAGLSLLLSALLFLLSALLIAIRLWRKFMVTA